MEIIVNHVKYNVENNKIIKDIYLEFIDGINVIVGNMGSGKTTLLDIISSDLHSIDGNVKIGKYSVEKDMTNKEQKDIKKIVGYVKQDLENYFKYNTVYDELSYYIDKYNHRTEEREKRVKDSLKMVSLPLEYIGKNICELSLSQKYQLALATVLIYNPKVIIIDDIFPYLDLENKNNLIKIIRTLKMRFKKTFIISSVDTDFLNKIADRVFVLNKGKLVLEGEKYEVFSQVRVLKKYGISSPFTVSFSNLVLNKKNKKIGYRDEINDLLKDIYRFTY